METLGRQPGGSIECVVFNFFGTLVDYEDHRHPLSRKGKDGQISDLYALEAMLLAERGQVAR